MARRATVRVNELEVSKNAMRLFLAVNHYLVLYSKFEDRIAHSELVAVSGLTYRRDFDEAKAELLAGEVLYCESGKGGRGKAAVWGYAQSLRNPPEKPSGETLRRNHPKPSGLTLRTNPPEMPRNIRGSENPSSITSTSDVGREGIKTATTDQPPSGSQSRPGEYVPAEADEGTAAATNGQSGGFVSKLDCPQCGQPIGSLDDVMSHLASEHPPPVANNGRGAIPEQTYEWMHEHGVLRSKLLCPECGQKCGTASGLASHIGHRHPDSPAASSRYREAGVA
ncbi:MAG: hypothetical protein H0U05_00200 [Actinobacteria bacterium]|nr:hypothetical protein [Actinomycetota bacterium]